MDALLNTFFSAICHQLPDRSWAPGGELLPCCHRCTGLYAGALIALALLVVLRPRLSGRFLWCHGLMLVAMVPFGLHWLPHGPVIRTVTGLLFGFGVTALLWLLPSAGWRAGAGSLAPTNWPYAATLMITIPLVPALSSWGSPVVAHLLTAMVASGALVLAVLVLANIVALLRGMIRGSGRIQTLPAA